jgi:dipeptidyl aminopeptidase/acylaminoacyl peptidase
MLRESRRAVALVAALWLAPFLPAQETRSDTLFTVEKYLDYEQVADPQISPDGSQIIYTRRYVDKLADRWESALWIMGSDGSRNRFLVRGSSPRWSADGTRIAYLADGQPRGTQIHVRWMDAEGATTQVSRLTDPVGDIQWSPDGKWIGFSMTVPATSTWKIDMPSPPSGATWTKAPRHVESLHYRQDRRGFTEPGFTHLFVIPAEGGTPRQVTSGKWSVGARFDGLASGVGWSWTTDGRRIVFDGLRDSTGADMNYRHSNVYSVDVATGSIRQLTPSRGTWSAPVVSPDGRFIAFTGYTDTLRASYRADDVWVMSLDGSGMRNITPALDRDPSILRWARDGSGVYFSVGDRGTSNVYFAPVSGAGARQLTRGVHMLGLGSVARTGVGAGIRSASKEPVDVVRIDLANGQVQRLTNVNEDLLARIKLGDVEEVWYTSSGGTRVQGWVVKPPGFAPTRKHPLIMEIHGGPHGMYNVGFNPMFQNFAANGYVVLYTNPRGSTGYGSAFGNAIQRAYPSVDYDDLMAGVDAVIAKGYVDTTRMYVGGCSGGGVLSSWVIGHTNRFAAAAVRCPVINWLSFAGQTDVPLFTYNFFDKPFWEDPQHWLRFSPLMHVGKVTTPTLIMTGELDLRTPMAQSEEYYAALKMRGVPTALLRFEGEYHGTSSRPSNWMRTQLYMMSWYQKWRRTSPTAASAVANSAER